MSEYAFLLDMQHNYGYLEENPPGGYDPREQLNDVTDPIVLQVKWFDKRIATKLINSEFLLYQVSLIML